MPAQAGISAGIEASSRNYSFRILESAKSFNTIINFPKNKPIIAAPDDFVQKSSLIINDGFKESLLDDLYGRISGINLPIDEEVMVDKIEKTGDYFLIHTAEKKYKALRVILAIGKTGNSRQLKVPGEELPKVFNRLIDPEEARGFDVLIVGGGDSALETAIAVAGCAKSVTISYRKPSFARPKELNALKLDTLVKEGKIKLMMESAVKEVKEDTVIIKLKDGLIELQNSIVYSMIGKELPTAFFKRSNIKIEGEFSIITKLQFALLLIISCVLYFGKSSQFLYGYFFGKLNSWSELFSCLFSASFWKKFFLLPVTLLNVFQSGEVKIWNTLDYLKCLHCLFCIDRSFIAWGYLLVRFFRNQFPGLGFNWNSFKYFYFITIGIFFTIVFFGGRYFGVEVLDKSQSFWYMEFILLLF